MGEAIITRRKTGATLNSNAFAFIIVTYPEGSTCTCTDGTTTLTSSTTNGEYTFAIPKSGTWTVNAASNTGTASKSVEITSQGQIETVELFFDLALYKAGDNGSKWTTFVGGGAGGRGAVTWGSSNIYIKGAYHATAGGGYNSGITYSTPINFDKCKTIKVTASSITGSGGAYLLVTSAPLNASESLPTSVYATLALSTGTKTLDVSSIGANKYLVIYAKGNSGNCNCYITNVSITTQQLI